VLSLSDIVNVKVGIGRGAFWTPGATVINGAKLSFEIVMKKLFSNGVQGFFYDPNDLSTMYQDAAGTVPVTGVGQAVGLIRDKSGRNNHAFQTTSASRPILRQNAVTGANYLEFDGSDDFLQTSNIDFTATNKMSLFVGVRKLSDASIACVIESGSSYGNPKGGFMLQAPPANGFGSYGAAVSGTAGNLFTGNINGYTSPDSATLSLKMDLSKEIYSDQLKLRINATDKTYSSGASAKGGNFANTLVYIGRRGGTTTPFNGHIYSLIGIGRLTTDSEIAAIEKELAKRTGVTLNV
jgi:hypothetical protein